MISDQSIISHLTRRSCILLQIACCSCLTLLGRCNGLRGRRLELAFVLDSGHVDYGEIGGDYGEEIFVEEPCRYRLLGRRWWWPRQRELEKKCVNQVNQALAISKGIIPLMLNTHQDDHLTLLKEFNFFTISYNNHFLPVHQQTYQEQEPRSSVC